MLSVETAVPGARFRCPRLSTDAPSFFSALAEKMPFSVSANRV